MKDERLKDIMAIPTNAFYKKLEPNSIFVIYPRTEKYEQDPDQLDHEQRKISFQLVLEVLRDKECLDKIYKLYSGEIASHVSIFFVTEEGKYMKEYRFTKPSLIRLLEQRIFDLPPDIYAIFQELVEKSSIRALVEKDKDKIYEKEVDGVTYKIPASELLEVFQLTEMEFLEISKKETIHNVPTPIFIYLLFNYLTDNNVDSKYCLTPELENRYAQIKESKLVDIQALNEITKDNDENFDQIEVDEELKSRIIRDMPSELNPLEKAIYIYLVMCKLLTYDEEFYALNQRGPVVLKHEDIKHVKEITLKNNRVVCYEFNAIYEKMLYDLGIHFSTNQALINGFGGGHANLEFRYEKFIIKADAVTSILQGDIYQAKMNQPIFGLVCKNKNEQTVNEFRITFQKVYAIVAQQFEKKANNRLSRFETFDEVLEQYSEITDKLKPISLDEKIQILIDKVNSSRLVGIDAYSYLLQLRKVLFTEQEQKDNLKITIIRNEEDEVASAKAIIAFRRPLEDGKYEVKYFIYSPGNQLIEISKEDLQNRFEQNQMAYIDKKDPQIPGIKGGK